MRSASMNAAPVSTALYSPSLNVYAPAGQGSRLLASKQGMDLARARKRHTPYTCNAHECQAGGGTAARLRLLCAPARPATHNQQHVHTSSCCTRRLPCRSRQSLVRKPTCPVLYFRLGAHHAGVVPHQAVGMLTPSRKASLHVGAPVKWQGGRDVCSSDNPDWPPAAHTHHCELLA